MAFYYRRNVGIISGQLLSRHLRAGGDPLFVVGSRLRGNDDIRIFNPFHPFATTSQALQGTY